MATVDTLLVRIEADMGQLKKQLNNSKRQVNESVGAQRRSFMRLGTTIKGVIGVVIAGAVARFGAQMVTMASAVEEMQAKSSVVFGNFVGSVRKELETFGDAVGRSTFELEGMASSVQDTFVPLGFARGEAAKLSTQLTKLAVDVASFNNASDVDTMKAFQSALVGNHETVRRFGIVITEAELNQELFRMGIRKTKDEITAQEKVQARLNLILAGTTDAQGDAERTADSFANTMKALRAEFDEFIVEAITPMLPALADMIRNLKDGIISMREFLRTVGIIDGIQKQISATDKLKNNTNELAEAELKLKKLHDENRARSSGGQTSFLGLDTTRITQDLENMGNGFFGTTKQIDNQITALKNHIQTLKTNREAILMATDAEIMAENASFDRTKQEAKEREEKQKSEKLAKQKAETEKKIKKALEDVTNQTKDLTIENKLLQASIDGKTKAQLALLEIDLRHAELTPEQLKNLKAQTEENIKLTKALSDQQDAQNLLKETEKERQQKIKDSFSNAESIVGTTRDFYKAQKDLNLALKNGVISQEQYNEGMLKLKEEQFALTESGQMAIKAVDGLSDGFANNLVNALENGKISLKSIGSVVKDVMAEMARDFLRAQIRAMLLKTAMSALGMGAPPSSAFTGGGNLSGVGNYAGGGTVQAKRPIMVGERGPELFVPNTGGVVRNNMDTRGMMGGGQVNNIYQNFNVSAGVSQTVRAEVLGMMPLIKEQTLNAVVDKKQRGGAFASALS